MSQLISITKGDLRALNRSYAGFVLLREIKQCRKAVSTTDAMIAKTTDAKTRTQLFSQRGYYADALRYLIGAYKRLGLEEGSSNGGNSTRRERS